MTTNPNWNFIKPIFRPLAPSNGIAHQEGVYYNQLDDKIQIFSIHLTGSTETVSSYAGEVKLFCELIGPEQPRTIAGELSAFQHTTGGLPPFAGELGQNLDKTDVIVDLDFLGLATVPSHMDNIGEQIQQMVDSVGPGELLHGLRQAFPEFSEATQPIYQQNALHFAIDPTVGDGHRHSYRLGGNGHVSMNIPDDTNVGAEVNLGLDNAQASPPLPSSTSQGFSIQVAASSNNCFLHIANNSGLSCSYTLDITRLGESFLIGDRAEKEN